MPGKCIYMGSHSLLGSKLLISCKGYNVNLQTGMAVILVLIECPKSIPCEVLVVLRLYQNVKSIRKAVFNLQGSQAISCLGYNVNLQNAVGVIFVFVECPKSLASDVLVIVRSYQNMKSIQQVVFNLLRSQAISCIGCNVYLQTVVMTILVSVECPKSIASKDLLILRSYSATPFERPPLLQSKSGLSRGVASRQG